jgi:pimeloyl-ACP methyl ester carboxylesterase
MLRRTLIAAAAAAVLAVFTVTATLAQDPPAMPAPGKSGYAPVNGVEVYYAVYGAGDPLVLLHGGFGMIEMFGPVLAQLAEHHTVIGVDLQAHGRTLPLDRPMTFEAMATDVAELVKYLGYDKADFVGYSTGGGVALRTAIDHPEVVDKLVLVSTPFAFAGWHDFNQQGMKGLAAAPEQAAEGMKQTPMYQAYAAVAPDPNNWVELIRKQGGLVATDYDWSSEVGKITAPTLLVVGDWDAVRASHAVQFFELLGGGRQDANWDRSGMNQNRLAILPDTTHYDIFTSPALSATVLPFLEAQ